MHTVATLIHKPGPVSGSVVYLTLYTNTVPASCSQRKMTDTTQHMVTHQPLSQPVAARRVVAETSSVLSSSVDAREYWLCKSSHQYG